MKFHGQNFGNSSNVLSTEQLTYAVTVYSVNTQYTSFEVASYDGTYLHLCVVSGML